MKRIFSLLLSRIERKCHFFSLPLSIYTHTRCLCKSKPSRLIESPDLLYLMRVKLHCGGNAMCNSETELRKGNPGEIRLFSGDKRNKIQRLTGYWRLTIDRSKERTFGIRVFSRKEKERVDPRIPGTWPGQQVIVWERCAGKKSARRRRWSPWPPTFAR